MFGRSITSRTENEKLLARRTIFRAFQICNEHEHDQHDSKKNQKKIFEHANEDRTIVNSQHNQLFQLFFHLNLIYISSIYRRMEGIHSQHKSHLNSHSEQFFLIKFAFKVESFVECREKCSIHLLPPAVVVSFYFCSVAGSTLSLI